MKGLLYKNYLATRRTMKGMFLSFFLIMVVSFIGKDGNFWSVYAVAMLSPYVTSLMRADETGKWNLYCDILPVSRKEIVSSYYIWNYLLLSAAVLLSMGIQALSRLVRGGESNLLEAGTTMIVTVFFMMAISIPLILQFGASKGMMIQMAFFFAVMLLVLASWDGYFGPLEFPLESDRIPVFMILLVIVMSVLSWWISVKLYENKELG